MIEILNKFARLASARSEVVGASLIILMIVMMVIPLSPALLDVLLAINISVAIVLVISAILIESPLAFSSFPAILLLTTLFRLSLTISTTRQILLEADAGEIIQTFGEFVVGGNIAVGLTIFLIISIVNFLVVTKGSERVAEVAARFSLDGMPGKQMSIDSDLRSGLITQSVARQRRSDLEKESQLFGAMDGAIKFVKNDAIAGLVITAVNLLGGLTVGMLQKGMSFSEAGSVYTILSVGDGLVGIIPSLMISIAAGLIVTRVTKGDADGSNTAQDMLKDLRRNTNALQISGIFCFFFAFVPGMPSLVFLASSAFLTFGWYVGMRLKTDVSEVSVENQFRDLVEVPNSVKLDDVVQTSTYCALEVRIPAHLEPTAVNQIQNICRVARNRRVEHLGVLIPIFEFTQHSLNFVEFYVYGVPCMRFEADDKRIQVFGDREELSKLSNFDFDFVKDPITGRYEILCDPVHKTMLMDMQIDHQTFETRLVEKIEVLITRKITQLFTLNEYQRHITSMGDQFGEQIKELERVMPVTKVVDVFQRLLSESVSVKNIRSILNSLIDWGQRERDPGVITEQVRRGVHEQICHQYTHDGKLNAYVVSAELEQIIRESLRSDVQGAFLDIDSGTLNSLMQSIENQLMDSLSKRHLPVVICSLDCRIFFRRMSQDSLFAVPIFSHQEISTNAEIRVLGDIKVDFIEQEDTFNHR